MSQKDLSNILPSLSYLDLRFGRLIERLHGEKCPEVFAAAALASAFVQQRHVCADLTTLAELPLPDEYPDLSLKRLPQLNSWLDILKKSPVVGKPEEFQPLILDSTLLYLYRYWDYESQLADAIIDRSHTDLQTVPDKNRLMQLLNELFPEPVVADPDLQKVAVYIASQKSICFITGGPGTGKTTTIAKILVLLLSDSHRDTPLRIALAAPTGKAAARLQQAINNASKRLKISKEVKEAIPREVSTIHRLLGYIHNSPYFKHTRANPLPYDVIIIDESSMVDLPLMAKLVDAVPKMSRLILLGDKDQLASVEAGAVLGHICNDNRSVNSFSEDTVRQVMDCTKIKLREISSNIKNKNLNDSIINLKKSYRFTKKSGIGLLSKAVNEGNSSEALSILGSNTYDDLSWRELPLKTVLHSRLNAFTSEEFSIYFTIRDLNELFNQFQKFQVLCAIRKGPYGVIQINKSIEKILSMQGLIDSKSVNYTGRPIMITENDYTTNLFNGDIGFILSDRDKNSGRRFYFLDKDGNYHSILPQRLPEHETVFAMTVHKSQGSEFDSVLLILPDQSMPVLTRELIYTAITRAKKRVEIWGSKKILKEAVESKITRISGLEKKLWSKN